MKPPSFGYFAPRTLDEAVDLLAQHGDEAKVLAGGQSLVPLLNLRLARPGVLIDINRIPELAHVTAWDGGLALGAGTRQATLERDESVRGRVPLLAEAARLIGHPAIRHRGTVGGSLAHADPASELPATMLALEATCLVRGKAGTRELPADQFFTGLLSTALQPDELLTEVRVPGTPPNTGAAFVELARRHGDFALAGVAALVTLNAVGRCERVRLALCGVNPTPLRVPEAEQALLGELPGGAALDEAAERAARACDPSSDVHASADYRRQMARAFTRRAVRAAAKQF